MHFERPTSNNRVKLYGLMGVAIGVGAFIFDLLQPLGVAAGIPYIGIIGLGLLARSRQLVIGFTCIGVVLIGLGYAFSSSSHVELEVAALNRAMSVIALLMVAIASYAFLRTRDRYQEELKALANVDSLTKTSNRRVILEQLEKKLRYCPALFLTAVGFNARY